MFGLLGLKNIAIAFALGLAIGGAGGLWGGYKMFHGDDAAEQVEELVKARKDDANAIANSQAKSEAIEAREEVIEEIHEQNQTEAQHHVEQPTPIPITRVDVHRIEGPGLSVPYQHQPLAYGLVCVLNSARDNRKADCPPAGSDAASRTVTEATFAAFVANDLQVVEMYFQLAARHGALVDYVLELQEAQRKRMGILDGTSVSSDIRSEATRNWEK